MKTFIAYVLTLFALSVGAQFASAAQCPSGLQLTEQEFEETYNSD
jgi:hypothetical protein